MNQDIFHGISDQDLIKVQKPAQYLGNEHGAITKPESSIELNVCLAFPDLYEVGICHLGLHILYEIVNRLPWAWAERAYAPQPDMERLLKEKDLFLSSLESKRPLNKFDLLGFTLQYELCASGILTILASGGIPLLSSERNETHPIVIGGGPLATHPEPFADFFDIFVVGDGEEVIVEILESLRDAKRKNLERKERIHLLSKIDGIYVPSYHNLTYPSNFSHSSITPIDDTKVTKRRILSSLNDAPFPSDPIVPAVRAIHDRLGIEIMRGCARGCRFCQAGYLYRPVRERSIEKIVEVARCAINSSGLEEVSLLSLSSADYCDILSLVRSLRSAFSDDKAMSVSFPSTRVDALTTELLKESLAAGRGNFTIAPEAGTQRMRDIINKKLTDEQIFSTVNNLFKEGCNGLKLYFMIGLPGETDEDVLGIAKLAKELKALAGRRKALTVSVSTFVPKPFTPFQWAEQICIEEIERRQLLLKTSLARSGVSLKWHSPFVSILEGVIARGDRNIGRVILRAFQLGSRLDGWDEHHKPELWAHAFEQCGINPNDYLKQINPIETLPWDHIDIGVTKQFLLSELNKSYAEETTPDCYGARCAACGVCDGISIKNSQRMSSSSDFSYKRENESSHSDTQDSTPQRYNSAVQRVRLRYTKAGASKYASHLDLGSHFSRAVRRAHLPIAWSEGYNPKPRLSFGPPTPLGLESDYEYVDLYFLKPYSCENILAELNKALPSGLSIREAFEISLSARSIQDSIMSQTFLASFDKELLSSELIQSALEDWPNKQATRIRKGETTHIPLSTCVTKIALDSDCILITLNTSTNSPVVKAEEVLQCLFPDFSSNWTIRKASVSFKTDANSN